MATRPSDLPEWASTAGATDLVEPALAKKQTGWRKILVGVDSIPEKPPYQEFNWFQNLVYKWLAYWADLTDAEFTQLKNIDTSEISSSQWGHLANTNQNVSTTSDVDFNSVDTGEVYTDTISEQTPNAGVTVGGVLCKDSTVTADDVKTDKISEETSGAGVTVDKYLIKDGIGGGFAWFSGTNAVDGLDYNTSERSLVEIGSQAVRLAFPTYSAGLHPQYGKKLRIDVTGATETNFLMLRADYDDAQEIIRMTGPGYFEVMYNASTGNPNLATNWTVIFRSDVAKTDTITESTPDKGVTIETHLLKDGAITSPASQGLVNSTGVATLTHLSPELININASGGTITQPIPRTNVKAGRIFKVKVTGAPVNETTSSSYVQLQSSSGGFLGNIYGNGILTLQALIDAPQLSLQDGNWRIVGQVEGGYRHLYASGVTNITVSPADNRIVKVTNPTGVINVRIASGSSAGNYQAGHRITLLVDGATETNYVALQASDSATHVEIERIGGNGFIEVMALRDNPTIVAHWRVINIEDDITVVGGASTGANTGAITAYVDRKDNIISVRVSQAAGTASAATSITSSAVIPTRMRPAAARYTATAVTSLTTKIGGIVTINTTGTLVFAQYANAAFGATGNLQDGAFTYTID
jgi:hypothetical protein